MLRFTTTITVGAVFRYFIKGQIPKSKPQIRIISLLANFVLVCKHNFGRGSERRISLLRLEFFFTTSKMAFELITTMTSQHQKWLFDHYIEKNEKNIKKISFVWFSHCEYLWRKYLWHFGVNKNFLTWQPNLI